MRDASPDRSVLVLPPRSSTDACLLDAVDTITQRRNVQHRIQQDISMPLLSLGSTPSDSQLGQSRQSDGLDASSRGVNHWERGCPGKNWRFQAAMHVQTDAGGCRIPCLGTVSPQPPSHKTIVIPLHHFPRPLLVPYHRVSKEPRNLCKPAKLGEIKDHAECV